MIRSLLLLTVSVGIFGTSSSWAFFESSKPFAGIGYMNENLTRTTKTYDGKASFMGTANDMPLFLGLDFGGSTSGSKWTPKIGYTFIPRQDADKSTKIEYLILSIPYLSQIGQSSFDYMLGTSYFRVARKGKGGTVSSSNGGSPATFYQGDETTTGQYMTLDFGLGYNFSPYRLALDANVISALSDKRSYNLSLNLSYYWGQN